MASTQARSSRPDDRRDQMLEAAAAVMAERGFAETRIADVAQRVGTSPALVVYYFATKDELLTEALRWSEQAFYTEVELLLGATTQVAERLAILVDRTLTASSGWALRFDLWCVALRRAAVRRDRAELDATWRALIGRVVREGIDAGQVLELDVESFVIRWDALLDGLVVQVALEDPVVDRALARRLALETAHRELGLPPLDHPPSAVRTEVSR